MNKIIRVGSAAEAQKDFHTFLALLEPVIESYMMRVVTLSQRLLVAKFSDSEITDLMGDGVAHKPATSDSRTTKRFGQELLLARRLEKSGLNGLFDYVHDPYLKHAQQLTHDLMKQGFRTVIRHGNTETLIDTFPQITLNDQKQIVTLSDFKDKTGIVVIPKGTPLTKGREICKTEGGYPLISLLNNNSPPHSLDEETLAKILWTHAASHGINKYLPKTPKSEALKEEPGYGAGRDVGRAYYDLLCELNAKHGYAPDPLLNKLIKDSKIKIIKLLPGIQGTLSNTIQKIEDNTHLYKTLPQIKDLRISLNEVQNYISDVMEIYDISPNELSSEATIRR